MKYKPGDFVKAEWTNVKGVVTDDIVVQWVGKSGAFTNFKQIVSPNDVGLSHLGREAQDTKPVRRIDFVHSREKQAVDHARLLGQRGTFGECIVSVEKGTAIFGSAEVDVWAVVVEAPKK